MTQRLLSFACHVYGVAAFAYLAHLVRQHPKLALVGRLSIAGALIPHAVALVLLAVGQQPFGLEGALSVVGFLLFATVLALDFKYRSPVIGTFLSPLALAAVAVGLLLPESQPPLPHDLYRPLLPVHVAIALAGMAAFAVAAAVGLMYLLLERQLKAKRFGMLFSRLPPLELLDLLNRRLVMGGFISLSVTLATGAFFAKTNGWTWGSREVATLLAWVLFGTLLSGRLWAGWQGKRAAVLTMLGFLVLLVSFLSYVTPSRQLWVVH